MNKLAMLAGGAALVAALAACSSSATSATAPHSATASAAPKSGTETLTGQVTGNAAVANTTTFPLKFTGPVNTTGTFSPPNTNATRQAAVFKTAAGDMAVNAIVSNPNGAPKMVNPAQCRFSFATTARYTIDGAKSTGSFAGAKGSGKATVTFTADAPKLSSGKCNMSQNAQPLTTGAIGVFHASGLLTLK